LCQKHAHFAVVERSQLETESDQHGKQRLYRGARLQGLLDGPSPVDFPEARQGRIEASILPVLRPVSPLPGVWRVSAALLLGSLAVIAVANWRLGVEGWDARSGLQSAVDFGLLGSPCWL
jgi:hypothetical protein